MHTGGPATRQAAGKAAQRTMKRVCAGVRVGWGGVGALDGVVEAPVGRMVWVWRARGARRLQGYESQCAQQQPNNHQRSGRRAVFPWTFLAGCRRRRKIKVASQRCLIPAAGVVVRHEGVGQAARLACLLLCCEAGCSALDMDGNVNLALIQAGIQQGRMHRPAASYRHTTGKQTRHAHTPCPAAVLTHPLVHCIYTPSRLPRNSIPLQS